MIHKDYLRGYIGFISTIKKLGFFIGKSSPEIPNLNRHQIIQFCHFERVNFKMSIVIGVIFLTSKVWTI